MKKFSGPILSLALATTLALSPGCKKSETTTEQTQPSASNPSKATVGASAEKNSFQEVTSHLDPGGSLYLYFSTEQILNGLSAKTSNLRQLLTALPNVSDGDRDKIDKGLNIITNLIKSSGI